MLRELHISNLAVIEDAAIELDPGLNCFTGQTGAGKSLILGAFALLLGLRSASGGGGHSGGGGGGTSGGDMIRPGADEARVSGLFEVRDARIARALAQAADLAIAPGDSLLITRKLFASGRSSTTVNGQPATASMVRALGEALVDVHGQHDHQYLLKPSNQLEILDAFGKSLDLREEYGQMYARWRQLVQRRAELSASGTLRRQQLDLYEFQAGEIDAAAPIEGELEQLRQRHTLLSNLRKIKTEAGSAQAALYEAEGAVVERVQMIAHVLGELVELDPRMKEIAELIRAATASLQDSAFELGRYLERLELDPEELARIEERLNVLNRLASKYSGAGGNPGAKSGGAGVPPAMDRVSDPVTGILAYRDWIEAEIQQLRGQDQDLTTIDRDIAEAQTALARLGGQLSKARRAAAGRLRPLVEAQLKELGMGEAEFAVDFAPHANAESTGPAEATAAGVGITAGASGLDQIEMMVRTNPGQPARPLRKIASGGEMSRIMLALKSILAQADRVSVLVFDEIDANIGGRMGTVIGRKLRALSGSGGCPRINARPTREESGGGGGQQVLCITHLPQIAAFADRHLRIAKTVEGKGKDKQTRTTVAVLAGAAREEELAEMLAGTGVTDTTRAQARELLEAAEGNGMAGREKSRGGGRRKQETKKAGKHEIASGGSGSAAIPINRSTDLPINRSGGVSEVSDAR